jgi:hypothetical protein
MIIRSLHDTVRIPYVVYREMICSKIIVNDKLGRMWKEAIPTAVTVPTYTLSY